MEPALDVIQRALQGDSGARSFLERTSSIYVLDATDLSKPKTYGCWNFIHQAMNEVERHEARLPHTEDDQGHVPQSGRGLVGHARLLASMALRVARRSPATDKALVATCISNASHYSGSEDQSQWLIDLNLELREIVMGRIAAMAFDFSFHRRTGPHSRSAFADRVVMDSLCAILSANAVSSGVAAIRHFATEWIIPSSRNLPSFAVASVILHLASEGKRTTAPAGTKDVLQQLSVASMSLILVPSLSDVVSEDSRETESLLAEERSQVAAMCLRAMKMWCDATDLSLPQIKHICSKVNANIVGVLSDAMYSDDYQVIDALAELIEATVQISDAKVMSQGRMNQVRHIVQVDEQSFQAQFTAQQLKTIESHEMASIVDELISAIGLQRFRFTERQNRGDFDVCRNLTTIASSVCGTWLDILTQEGQTRQPEPGAVALLLKAAGHPSVNLCAISLNALIRMIPTMPSLAHELLPTLQRRAITPHCLRNGRISLDAADVCGVSYHEFQNFRENVLKEALLLCWRAHGNHFMDSCTSAVEEFCSVSSSNGVSLQLEAALFCIEKIADEALDSHNAFPHHEQMKRLLSALSLKPASLMVNPLTRERMCSFLRKYTRWCVDNDGLNVGTELALSCVRKATEPEGDFQSDPYAPPASVREACLTLKEFFCSTPKYFADDAGVASLSALWETCYASIERSTLMNIQDRVALSSGICHVLAALPSDQRMKAFEGMASQPLGLLERLSGTARDTLTPPSELSLTLPRIGGEIRVLSSMSRSFASALASGDSDAMDSGCDTSPDRLAPIPEPVLQIVHGAWSNIAFAAANWVDDETVACSLTELLSDLLPPTCHDAGTLKLLEELCSLTTAVLKKTSSSRAHFEVAFEFVGNFVTTYGEDVEKGALATLSGSLLHDNVRELGRLLEKLILDTVAAVQENLGNVWTSPMSEQGMGEDAFERKPSPVRKPQMKSNESLAGILCFLTKAMGICPVFLLHLPASSGKDHEDDMLLRRAVDSAVVSLNDSDPEIARNSIAFLGALIKHNSSMYPNLRSFVSESLSRIRGDTISRLVLGTCGKFEYTAIGMVADLFVALIRTTPLSTETEAHLTASLRQEDFLLGDPAKILTLSILSRCGSTQNNNPLRSSDLATFLEDVWQLHQVEDTDALPLSDEVARFLRKYS